MIVATEQANLLDVFEQAAIELEVDLTEDDVVEATSHYDGITVS